MQEPFQVFDGVTLHKVSEEAAEVLQIGEAVGMTTGNEVLVLKNVPGFPIYGHVIEVDREACEVQVKKKDR